MEPDIADPTEALTRIALPLRLTHLGLWAERLCRAFWPLWTITIGALGALSFGLQDHLPLEAEWFAIVSTLFAAIWAAYHGWRAFHRPTRDEALNRLDARLPGRPIAALRDSIAIGASDPAAQAVWQAHQTRMAARAAAAKPVKPDLRLASRDPFALRYVALTLLVMALIFGSLWRITSLGSLTPGTASLAANAPSWEGWAQPPAYTHKPTLYLADQTADALTLPAGTRIQLKFYGDAGALILAETVSGRTNAPPASQPTQDFTVTQSGRLAIQGTGGREWQVTLLPDAPPAVEPKGEIGREADGRFKQEYVASDDYGVTKGEVTIALDLSAVDRRFGLTANPEDPKAVTLDLPMTLKRDKTKVDQTLTDDLSKDLLANLPVTMTFSATDAAGQTAHSKPLHVTLPGRRFFDPLAASLIEQRRDLLWNRSNAPEVVQVLKAITHQPDGFIRNEKAYLRLREVIRQLDPIATSLDAAKRDELTEELWQISLMVEDGDLGSAMERLKRAQDRLDQAIRNGASPAEIDKLMQDMKDALNDYMKQQLQANKDNPNSQQPNGPTMKLSQDQLQQMLDKLQQLMKEGRTAEAEQLMQQLRDFMNNMQVTQGDGTGSGQGTPGDQAMKDLGQALRDQQKLSDDSFHDMQQGQDGQASPDANGKSLADRQKALGDTLNQMQKSGRLPGAGDPQGQEGRKQMDRAGKAMSDAERALRNGDLPGALDRQAEALDAMRQGIRNFGEALAQEQRQGTPQGQASNKDAPRGQRDPLGRDTGQSAQTGTDRSMLQGDDVYRRAQDLLDEIRKRAGQQQRPDTERSYLRRLLDLF